MKLINLLGLHIDEAVEVVVTEASKQ